MNIEREKISRIELICILGVCFFWGLVGVYVSLGHCLSLFSRLAFRRRRRRVLLLRFNIIFILLGMGLWWVFGLLLGTGIWLTFFFKTFSCSEEDERRGGGMKLNTHRTRYSDWGASCCCYR